MKKTIALLLALCMLFALTACGNKAEAPAEPAPVEETAAPAAEPAPAEEPEAEPVATDIFAKSEGVMTFDEYAAAEVDSEVTVEAFVQAHQSWWDNQITVYAQDDVGGYFFYNMACSEEDAAKLVPGTKIKVTGFKSEWAGEVEIVDATFEIEEGSYIAQAEDVTALLGTDDLINEMNKFVGFNGMKIAASKDADGNDVAFLYNWDGSGEDGSDLYFNVEKDGNTYQFTVESYLCGAGTEVYEAVKAMNIGDVVNLEGFLYWYEGVNPHITSLENVSAKSEGVMTFDEYAAAEVDSEVTVEAYVQAHQSWWEDQITVYAEDGVGGYFFYNMACSEEDAAKLVPGTKIKVTGFKSEWAGEVEIIDATFEIEEGSYIASAADVTALLGTEEIAKEMNKFVSFKGMTVAASKDADGNDVAFLYNWDGSGEDGNDLYFNVEKDGKTYQFTVESYLCGAGTEVYEAVKALNVGDVVDLEGFLYWYEGINPHITSCKAA